MRSISVHLTCVSNLDSRPWFLCDLNSIVCTSFVSFLFVSLCVLCISLSVVLVMPRLAYPHFAFTDERNNFNLEFVCTSVVMHAERAKSNGGLVVAH